MDHLPRPAERPSPNVARILALALLLTGALGLVAGCKSSDEKPADDESAVALQIPESGELPGAKAAEATDEAAPEADAAAKPGAPALRTSA
ncbi:MAG: hypothetical protein EP329_12665, partial [Deltaproteobacteria bacterium]